MGKAQAALSIISSEIIDVSQDCFAQASNIFKLDITADKVSISGLTVDSTISTNIGTCSTNSGISTGPLHVKVDSALNKIKSKSADGTIVDAFSKYQGTETPVNLKTTIRDQMGVEVINRCLAVALNSIIIRIQNARSVNIQDVSVKQTATAEITECVANVDIKIGNTTQSLQQFLERNEDQYDVDGFVPPPECTGYETAKQTLTYGAVGAFIGALILIAGILLARYIEKHKLL